MSTVDGERAKRKGGGFHTGIYWKSWETKSGRRNKSLYIHYKIKGKHKSEKVKSGRIKDAIALREQRKTEVRRGLITEDAHRAQEMITRLASILRYALRMNRSATVSLDEEMKMVISYLSLEAVRLEERLSYDLQMSDECREIAVPPMMIQTLVENAIKHGIAPRIEGGRVTIEAVADHEQLCVKVTNTGEIEPGASATGVGLENARERLRLIYGERGTLHLLEDPPGTVCAELIIPLKVTTQ